MHTCLRKNYKFSLFINNFNWFLLLNFNYSQGFVLPDKANPIIAYRNNDGAWSSYTFYLKMQTRIPANSQGEIRLTFPQDYGVGSGAGLYRLKDDTLALNDECPVYLQISVQTICPKFYNPNFPLPPPALTLSIPMDTVELPAGSV